MLQEHSFGMSRSNWVMAVTLCLPPLCYYLSVCVWCVGVALLEPYGGLASLIWLFRRLLRRPPLCCRFLLFFPLGGPYSPV